MAGKWMILLLLVLPTMLNFVHQGPRMACFADAVEDDVEGEDEDAEVVDDGSDDEDLSEEPGKNVHPDADTLIYFTKPQFFGGSEEGLELPGGQIAEFLVGFANKGEESELVVETLEASFRYPMDYRYHIQNFSAIAYGKTVKAGHETTFMYSFIPADAFAGRPIGLTINLAYKDLNGNTYIDPIFNQTVQIVEFDEGFDTEIFFMYVFLVTAALLLLFLVYSFAFSRSKGKKPASKAVETGTNDDGVDYEWIPRSALKTPGSNKTSPRQRKGKRTPAGSDTE